MTWLKTKLFGWMAKKIGNKTIRTSNKKILNSIIDGECDSSGLKFSKIQDLEDFLNPNYMNRSQYLLVKHMSTLESVQEASQSAVKSIFLWLNVAKDPIEAFSKLILNARLVQIGVGGFIDKKNIISLIHLCVNGERKIDFFVEYFAMCKSPSTTVDDIIAWIKSRGRFNLFPESVLRNAYIALPWFVENFSDPYFLREFETMA